MWQLNCRRFKLWTPGRMEYCTVEPEHHLHGRLFHLDIVLHAGSHAQVTMPPSDVPAKSAQVRDADPVHPHC
jgi:hypothetical protein